MNKQPLETIIYQQHVTTHCLFWKYQNPDHSKSPSNPSFVATPDGKHHERMT